MENTQNAAVAAATASSPAVAPSSSSNNADDNDSDNDVVTDFLNSNCNSNTNGVGDVSAAPTAPTAKILHSAPRVTVESQNYCIPVINAPVPAVALPGNNNINTNNIAQHGNNNNMIPTINVTPHSPASASKYNNIFEDTLSQLQNIRETVQQMKNSSSSHNQQDGLANNYGLLNAAILSASLPDLSNAGGTANANGAVGINNMGMMWSAAPQQCLLLHTDRRKSWTAVDDANTTGDCTNKSVSLSSLDSEEQETIRVTEQRRRSARNSTGGKGMLTLYNTTVSN